MINSNNINWVFFASPSCRSISIYPSVFLFIYLSIFHFLNPHFDFIAFWIIISVNPRSSKLYMNFQLSSVPIFALPSICHYPLSPEINKCKMLLTLFTILFSLLFFFSLLLFLFVYGIEHVSARSPTDRRFLIPATALASDLYKFVMASYLCRSEMSFLNISRNLRKGSYLARYHVLHS